MNLKDISRIFNRSCGHIFDVQKLLSVFSILLFSGLIFLFFQSFAGSLSPWAKLPLLIIPFFVTIFLLMISGINLVRTYSQEREGNIVKKTFLFSKELCLKSCYFLLPIFFTLLILWILLGIFILLKSIPYLGVFLSIILSFVPFLINLGILLSFLSAFLVLFFFTPILSLKKNIDRNLLIKRLRIDLFAHFIFIVLAFIPLWIIWLLLTKAVEMTFSINYGNNNIIKALQGLFILIPFSAFLTIPVVFFFNFSLEAYLMTAIDNGSSQENT